MARLPPYLILIWPKQYSWGTVLMAVVFRLLLKHGVRVRHRNTLSYYQLGLDAEVKRPYTKRRGSGRSSYLHPAVSTHEKCRAPPPPLHSFILGLERLGGVARGRIHIGSDGTDASRSLRTGTVRDCNVFEIGGPTADRQTEVRRVPTFNVTTDGIGS
jgi:hypothetical protein